MDTDILLIGFMNFLSVPERNFKPSVLYDTVFAFLFINRFHISQTTSVRLPGSAWMVESFTVPKASDETISR